jgi:isocitrate lyase
LQKTRHAADKAERGKQTLLELMKAMIEAGAAGVHFEDH